MCAFSASRCELCPSKPQLQRVPELLVVTSIASHAEHMHTALHAANWPSSAQVPCSTACTAGVHARWWASAAPHLENAASYQSNSQLPASVHLTPALIRRLDRMATRFEQLGTLMVGQTQGDTTQQQQQQQQPGSSQDLSSIAREYGELQPVVELYQQYRGTQQEVGGHV